MKEKSKRQRQNISVKESAREVADQQVYPVTLRPQPLLEYYFPAKSHIIQEFSEPGELREIMDIMLRNFNASVSNPMEKIEKTFITKYFPLDENSTPLEIILKCKVKNCVAFIRYVFGENQRYSLAEAQVRHKHRRRRNLRGRTPGRRNEDIEQYYDELLLLNYKPKEILENVKEKFNISKPHFYSLKFCRTRREGFSKIKQVLGKYDDFYLVQKNDQDLLEIYRIKEFNGKDRTSKLISQISKREDRGLPQKTEEYPSIKREVPPEGDDKISRRFKDKDICILISKKMKEKYKVYHKKYIILSVFANMALQTRYHRDLRYHHMGILYGQDCHAKLDLLFGIVFFRKRTKICYRYIIQKMFGFLEQYSQVLLTDYDPPLREGLEELMDHRRLNAPNNNFRIHIVLPSSFTAILQDRLSVPFNSLLSSELPILLTEMDREKHNARLTQIINCAKDMNDKRNLDGIYSHLLPFIKKYSFLELPQCFIGLCMTGRSMVSRLKAMILEYFKSPRPLLLAIKAVFAIFDIYEVIRNVPEEQINRRINRKKQSQLQIQKFSQLQRAFKYIDKIVGFKRVFKSLSPSAALILQEALEKCLFEDVELVQDKVYEVLEGLSKFQYPTDRVNMHYRIEKKGRVYPYEIKRVLNLEVAPHLLFEPIYPQYIWRCECKYYSKVGLPCWHELKVCLLEKNQLIHQINPFWFIKEEPKRAVDKGEEPIQQQQKISTHKQQKSIPIPYTPPTPYVPPHPKQIPKLARDSNFFSLVEQLRVFDFESDPLNFSSVSSDLRENGTDHQMSIGSGWEQQTESKQDGFEIANPAAMQLQMPLQELEAIYNSEDSQILG